MNRPAKAHLLFDFDGVLVDSARIKAEAFLEVLPGLSAEACEAIRKFVEFHGGLSRFEKFRQIYTRILEEPLPEKKLEELCDHYSRAVFDRVKAAPEIAGVRSFLAHSGESRSAYVVSGTPQVEVRALVEARGWNGLFVEVLGSPDAKTTLVPALLQRRRIAPSEALFFGDSVTDWEAARQSGIDFIGIGEPWAGAGGRWFPDFSTIPAEEILS